MAHAVMKLVANQGLRRHTLCLWGATSAQEPQPSKAEGWRLAMVSMGLPRSMEDFQKCHVVR